MFDEEPTDPHGECEAEIRKLQLQVAAYRLAVEQWKCTCAWSHVDPGSTRKFFCDKCKALKGIEKPEEPCGCGPDTTCNSCASCDE